MPEPQSSPALARLAELLLAYTPYDGPHALRVPGVSASRRSRVNGELLHGLYRPTLCIVAQGAKTMFLGPEVLEYSADRMLMCSLDLPVSSQVSRATPDRPFLCLVVSLEPQQIAELSLKVFPLGIPAVRDHRAVAVADLPAPLLGTAVRLMEVMADERDAELLGPLIIQEMLIRLLRSPLGARVAQIGHGESSVQRVAKAVDWVRNHYDEPMNVDLLAKMVHMSTSSFHQHFKAVTSLSPLQFQKELRLREARRLMLTSQMDASTASRQVGYQSASQFTREYGRLFGHAPGRDIARLREQGQMPVGVN